MIVDVRKDFEKQLTKQRLQGKQKRKRYLKNQDCENIIEKEKRKQQ